MPCTWGALRTVGRSLWWSTTSLAGTVGVASSYLFLGTRGALLLAGLTALLATTTGRLLSSETTSPSSETTSRRPVPSMPLLALVGAGVGLAAMGLILGLGPAGLVISAGEAATGWCVLHGPRQGDGTSGSRLRAATRIGPPEPPGLEQPPPDPLPSLSSLRTLTTAELCQLWQVTAPRPGLATSPARTERLMEVRHGCLTELEQRDPAAFGRWLPTAGTAGDPARFFRHGPSWRSTGDVTS
jgi:hypothetical protein